MTSRRSRRFRDAFAAPPASAQAQAHAAYTLWRANPHHPGLQFKRVRGQAATYSVRIGLRWRALGAVDGDTITWFWIGPHAEYDQLIS